MASFVSLRCPECRRRNTPAFRQGMLYTDDSVGRGRWRCPRCHEIFLLVGDDGRHMMEPETASTDHASWDLLSEGKA